MGSKGSNTTTTNSAPSPQAQALIGNATKAARSAYDWGMQYNPVNWKGELVAPVNQQQYQGIAGINQYANAAQPMVNMAEGWIQQAAQPITAQNIQQYMDPFTNQVIQATQADFANQNAIQRQGVVGNAIAQGAFGGNREAIAEAELAHQQASAQDPIIAQLRSQGYQTGLNTALTEQQNRANQAYGLANVAGSGQNLGLTGANAQIGAGGLEQGTQQALDTALWNKYMMTGAYPMQLAQAQAGIELPAASYEGGTSTTTGPAPSIFSQIAGLGTAGLGLFGSTGAVPYMFPKTAARGGVVDGYDGGGFVDADPYIKTVNIPGGPGPPKPPSAPSQQAQSPLQGLGSLGTVLGGKGGLIPALGSAFSSGITSLGEAMPEVGAALADAAPFIGLALNRGGNVHGYDDGGVVTPNPDPTGMLPYSKPQGIYPLQYPSFKTNIPNVNISHGSGIPKPPSIQGQSQNDLNNQAKQIGSLTKAIMGDRSQSAQDAAQDAEQDAVEDARRGGGIRGYAEGGTPPDRYYDPLASQSGVVRVPTEIGIHDDTDTDSSGTNDGIGYNPDFSFSDLPASDPAGIKSDASIKYRENPYHQYLIKSADKLAGEPGRTDDIPAELPPLPTKKFRDDPDVPEDYARARSPFSQLTSYADERRRPVAEQPQARGLSGMFSGVDLSANSKLWPALMSAGFGMMASRSPFAGVGIGEGGQQGVKTYNELSEQEKRHNLTQQQIDQHATQLSDQAKRFEKEYEIKAATPHVINQNEDIYGGKHSTYGVFDPVTKKMVPIQATNSGKPNETTIPLGSKEVKYDNIGRPMYINESTGQPTPITEGASLSSEDAALPAAARPADWQGNATPIEQIRPAPPRSFIDENGRAHGQALLDQMVKNSPESAAMADVVKQIDEGRQLPPTGMMLRTPYGRQLQMAISQYDPDFDVANARTRAGTLNKFKFGKGADALTSFNTSIQHLGELRKAVEDLDNYNNLPGLMNQGRAIAQGNLPAWFGDAYQKARAKFNAARTAVTDELTRAFRLSGGNVHDIKAWEANLDPNGAKTTQVETIAEAVHLLDGRIESVGNEFNRGMRLSRDPISLLSPKAQQTINALREGSVPGREGSTESLPDRAKSMLKEGVNQPFANGQIWTLRNGVPVRVK